MAPIRTGVMTFADGFRPSSVYEDLWETYAVPEHRRLLEVLKRLQITPVSSEEPVRNSEQVLNQVALMRREDVGSVLLYIPTWTNPNIVLNAANLVGRPVALLTQRSPASAGVTAFLASAGALAQAGVKHKRIWGDIEEARVQKELLAFLRAASVLQTLRGQRYGVFGGISLGIYQGSHDPSVWQKLFGIDTLHVDQLEIVRRAEQINPERAERFCRWLEQNCASIEFDGKKLTREKLLFQIRCYLATKQLVEENQFDFIGVKCHPELSGNYVSQCLTHAFFNDLNDDGGRKESIVCACEVDGDAALAMQMLKLISGGKPTLMMDVSYLDEEKGLLVCSNCGAHSLWYSARSDKAEENIRKVQLCPVWTEGGGACTFFACAPGEATFTRLYRTDGKYTMIAFKGNFVGETVVETSSRNPVANIKAEIDYNRLIQNIGSQHLIAVDGDYTKELEELCALSGIEHITLNR